jgi:hypothetical protein
MRHLIETVRGDHGPDPDGLEEKVVAGVGVHLGFHARVLTRIRSCRLAIDDFTAKWIAIPAAPWEYTAVPICEEYLLAGRMMTTPILLCTLASTCYGLDIQQLGVANEVFGSWIGGSGARPAAAEAAT